MRFEKVFIPYGAFWSSPFCRWRGSLGSVHPLKLAADCAIGKLQTVQCTPEQLGGIHFGMTVPQHQSFYGAPWIGALIGATHVTGPTLSQACATSARVLASAASAIELGQSSLNLALAADRISNGPHIYYPDSSGPGGMGTTENWVWDNFNKDPYAKVAMIETAENIASRFGFTRQVQDDLTVHRYQQYQMALADDRTFQKRYMSEVSAGSKKQPVEVSCDEGIFETTAQGVKKLQPVIDGGTVTYATQTHPADGNAGMLLGSKKEVHAVRQDNGVAIQLLAFGEGRAERAHMGMAPVPAANAALNAADIRMDQIAAVKTHNPFVVNDLYFAQETGFPVEKMNNFGCSLIFGHPQGPTGMRLLIELIEELVLKGGGYGLFTGCAAGDTGAALVIKVG